MRYILMTLIALCSVSEADADQLLSTGPLQINGTEQAVCSLVNIGNSSVALSPLGIYVDYSLIPSTLNTCGKTLAVGKSCKTVSAIEIANYFECRISVADKTNLRGVLEARRESVTIRHEALR